MERRNLAMADSADNNEQWLYHYTSHQGLLGILGGERISIRATAIGHLNDPTEFQYAHDLLERCIAELGILIPGKHDRLREALRCEAIKKCFTAESFFIFCLSEDGNLISQWRSYCPQGGYSIGFSRSLLHASIGQYLGRLERCVYDLDEQRPLVEEKLRQLVSDFDKKCTAQNECDIENIVILWYRDWIRLAIRLKDGAYAAEREWRVVIDQKQVDASISNNTIEGIGYTIQTQVGFRVGSWGVIPYREVILSYPGEPCVIEQIVIGPNPYKDIAKSGVDALLKKSRLDETILVKTSDIPFRYI